MSELSDLIFHGAKHKLTSPFGKREIINTSGGATSSFHSGTDYGTYNKKLAQYAAADGEVLSCGVDTAYGGAKYVWVKYPSLGVKMLHYHLDSYCVKKGQSVNQKTLLGYTGKTGKATGIHLHLGIKLLSDGSYTDPEKWSDEVFSKIKNSDSSKTQTEKQKYKTGNYIVTADVLCVRQGAGTSYAKKTFTQLSSDAQKKICALSNGRKVNGYVKGVAFTVVQIKDSWGKTPSGWVCLDYCTFLK